MARRHAVADSTGVAHAVHVFEWCADRKVVRAVSVEVGSGEGVTEPIIALRDPADVALIERVAEDGDGSVDRSGRTEDRFRTCHPVVG